jgi:hypothetical protein
MTSSPSYGDPSWTKIKKRTSPGRPPFVIRAFVIPSDFWFLASSFRRRRYHNSITTAFKSG